MPEIHFTDLLIVVVVAFAAPLALGFFPRVRLLAIVLEIILGIVIGPAGLGWVEVALPIQILSLIGLAFLLFLSGLEIDVQKLRGRVLRLTALGFAASFGIGIVAGFLFDAGGFVQAPLFIPVIPGPPPPGGIVPGLEGSHNIGSEVRPRLHTAAS